MMKILFQPVKTAEIKDNKFEVDQWAVTMGEGENFEIDTGAAVDEYACMDDLSATIDRLTDIFWILKAEKERIDAEKEKADLEAAQQQEQELESTDEEVRDNTGDEDPSPDSSQ
jgi:hypothetical protein